MKSSNSQRTRIALLALGSALLLPVSSQASLSLAFDDFQNRAAGDGVNGSITSDGQWKWHSVSGNATFGERNGNIYVAYPGVEVLSMTLQDAATNAWLTYDAAQQFSIGFDFLHLHEWGDNQYFNLDYLVSDRYTNMAATAQTDPTGYRLSVRVVSNTSLEYRIRHKAGGTWSSVPGTEGSFTSTGLVHIDRAVPGNPVSVRLEVDGHNQRLLLDGQEVFNVSVDPHAQNSSLAGDRYFQIWNSNTRHRAMDNFQITVIPEPATVAFWLGLALGALVIGMKRRSRARR
jgi:hypothetical protein